MTLFHKRVRYAIFFFVFGLGYGLLGCSSGPEYQAGPPDGWLGSANGWWLADTDTAAAFRNLSTFDAMGFPLEEVVYGQGEATARAQLINGVKKEFMPMFQSNPELVDSLFQTMGHPKIMRATLGADLSQTMEALNKQIFRSITRHYQQPRTLTRLGSFDQAKRDDKIVPIFQPDSLKAQEVYGRVKMQVYLNPEGEPQAIKRLASVHPVLDNLAMQAATKMRWRPAYLRGEGVPGWALFNVNYQAPQ